MLYVSKVVPVGFAYQCVFISIIVQIDKLKPPTLVVTTHLML